MQPDQASFLLQFLLPQLKSEHAVTLKIFAAVPPDRETYRPDAKAMSAFQLARHIAMTEIWFLDSVLSKRFDEIVRPPEAIRTCRDLADWYSANVSQRIALVEALPGDHLATPVDWLELRKDPAVAYLNIAIRHSVHHRGQLSAYLRAVGAHMPAIYVESADEPYPPADGSAPLAPPPAF